MTQRKIALSIEEAADYTGIGKHPRENWWNGRNFRY